MRFNSYAQNFEDVMLWRVLNNIESGFYIDIGAQHPCNDSVTKAFYERGWRGINVEPVFHWFDMLQNERPKDINLNIAIGAQTEILDLYEIAESGLSTLDKSVAEFHRLENNYEIITHKIAVHTLTDVCVDNQVSEIHFLKIDVEGYEKHVLEGINFNRVKPWIILIESTKPNTKVEVHEQWEFILIDAGYTFVYFDGLNRFYVAKDHTDLISRFSSPPNVFDDFSFAVNAASNSFCANYSEQLAIKDRILHDAASSERSLIEALAAIELELKDALEINDALRAEQEKMVNEFHEQLGIKDRNLHDAALSESSLIDTLTAKESELKDALGINDALRVEQEKMLREFDEQLVIKDRSLHDAALSESSLIGALAAKESELKDALGINDAMRVEQEKMVKEFDEQLDIKDRSLNDAALSESSLIEALAAKESELKDALGINDAMRVEQEKMVQEFDEQLDIKDRSLHDAALSESSLIEALAAKESELKDALGINDALRVEQEKMVKEFDEQLDIKDRSLNNAALSESSLIEALAAKESELKDALGINDVLRVEQEKMVKEFDEQLVIKDRSLNDAALSESSLIEALAAKESELKDEHEINNVLRAEHEAMVKELNELLAMKDYSLHEASLAESSLKEALVSKELELKDALEWCDKGDDGESNY